MRGGRCLEFLRVSKYSCATEGKGDAVTLELTSVSVVRDSLELSASAEVDGEDGCLVRSLSCWTVFERGTGHRSWEIEKRS